MEKSYISKMDKTFLESIQITSNQTLEIEKMINTAIKENLYTNTLDFKHDLKHIERVMIYIQWIINEKEKNGERVENQDILKTAALYHDIGKSVNSSNELHGTIGSIEFRKKKQGILSDDCIDKICALIETHAVDDDKIHLLNVSNNELENLQLLSNILKDADALDRNRLNYPAPIGTCDEKKLRTNEAKQIFQKSDLLLKEYMASYIKGKEQNLNTKIMNNYEKLKLWLDEYNAGVNNIYHASLDPTIEKLVPQESTQAGNYVYADVDPVHCTKMASFRLAMLFKRERDPITGESIMLDVFPGTTYQTLKEKYITIYKLPKKLFRKYETEVTSAKSGEYVSENIVIPEDQITFPALDYFKFLSDNHKFKLVENTKEEKKVESVLASFRTYIWNIKKEANDPQIYEKSYGGIKALVEYYCPEYTNAIEKNRLEVDKLIAQEKEKYRLENNGPFVITDENETFLKKVETKYFESYVNKDYINKIITNSANQSKSQQIIEGAADISYTTLSEEKNLDEKQNAINEERQNLLQQKRDVERKQLMEQKSQIELMKNNEVNSIQQNNKDKPMMKKLSQNIHFNQKKGFTNILMLSLVTGGFIILVVLLTLSFIK